MISDEIYKVYVKKYFYSVGILTISIGIFVPCIFYIMDPLQLFHKSWFQDEKLSGSMREQAAGIINIFEFDSIILGTSMLENTSSREASQKLGGKFVNISLSGSNFYERHFVLKKVLKKGIKKVLYSLDSVYINCARERNDYKTDTWSYLYDDSIVNDFRIYFTIKYIRSLFSPVTGLRIADYDRPNAWMANPYHSRRFGGLENWIENVDNPQVNNFLLKDLPALAEKIQNGQAHKPYAEDLEEKVKSYIDDNIIIFCKKYPSTQFFLIFPPYYRYRYLSMKYSDYDKYALHQFVIKYFVSLSQYIKNIHIYGFEDQPYADNIENYKDTGHYHYSFNSYMLDAIAQNRHMLNAKNIENYLLEAERRLHTFDIVALNKEAQSLLRARGALR